MAVCTISGTIQDLSGDAVADITVTARIITSYFTDDGVQISPQEVFTTTDDNGEWSLDLIQGSSAIVDIEYNPSMTTSTRPLTYSIIVPEESTADFSELATEL